MEDRASVVTVVEAVARRTRLALTCVLVVVPLAGWIWVVAMARDMYGAMSGSAAWMMVTRWDAMHLLLLWAMWAAMMAAMMMPSAAPVVLLFAGAARRRPASGSPALEVYALAAGYLLVWAVFSVAATVLQRILSSWLVLTPMMEPARPQIVAALLVIAGVYQLTPLKQACLRFCRSPMALLGSRWRSGVDGAFRMGIEHGVSCLGCCWALMLLLFAGGVMNLAVILTLTTWVAIEKIAPLGQQSARLCGALLVGAGVWMWLR